MIKRTSNGEIQKGRTEKNEAPHFILLRSQPDERLRLFLQDTVGGRCGSGKNVCLFLMILRLQNRNLVVKGFVDSG
ncbi:MAG: hypothetical protein CR981_02400 [Proteobacteria bacterium]|nr:MAG: hypothetical protein CR981_02400 [Pseudomonadota bacterium]PIE64875.1 MAG: hypothetical protein CSA26_05960 [Desulfobacterales bacterium]